MHGKLRGSIIVGIALSSFALVAGAAPGVDPALLTKVIEVSRLTNNMRMLSLSSRTPFLPGEQVVAQARHPDGRVEKSHTSYNGMTRQGTAMDSTLFSWYFPPAFGTNEIAAAMAQIQQVKTDESALKKLVDKTLGTAPSPNSPTAFTRVLELSHLRPFTLFSVTNQAGLVYSGLLHFERSLPEKNPAAPVVGTIRSRKLLRPSRYLSISFDQTVPPGYALVPTVTTSSGSEAMVSTTRTISQLPQMNNASWMLPGWPAETVQAGIDQITRLAEGPALSAEPDKPALVFAITNSTGEVAKGFFELKSAK